MTLHMLPEYRLARNIIRITEEYMKTVDAKGGEYNIIPKDVLEGMVRDAKQIIKDLESSHDPNRN